MTQGTKVGVGVLIALLIIAAGLYAWNTDTRNTNSTEETKQSTSTPPLGGDNPNPAGTVETGSTNAQKCASQGGTWSEEYKECTGIGANSCQEIGGTFNECASACRHDPNAQACIMMCVQVCTLN